MYGGAKCTAVDMREKDDVISSFFGGCAAGATVAFKSECAKPVDQIEIISQTSFNLSSSCGGCCHWLRGIGWHGCNGQVCRRVQARLPNGKIPVLWHACEGVLLSCDLS